MSHGAALRLGDRGDKVRQLQAALDKAGFQCAADGIFGPSTEHAVKTAQEAHGLTPDGIAGALTRTALAPKARPAKDGGQGLTPRGAAFIGHFEGFSSKLYNDPVNHCTIGFGHLVHRGPINGNEPADFKSGITRERGLELLREDANEAAEAIERLVKVDLEPHQRDALISFTYNLGTGAFGSSTLLKLLNQGDHDSVPAQLNRWTKASGKVLPGLVTRRRAEGALFSTGTYVT
jgi:lysozyme